MSFLDWKPLYSVGVPEMDEQHITLVGFMNKFYDENAGGRIAEAKSALDSLVKATRNHFSREEAMMARCRYPDLEPHKADHVRLLDTVAKSVATYAASPTPQNAENLAKFLRTWLVNHIMGTDKRYTKYAQA
jgi:hemerythrin